jgi:hypothetical protein
VSGVCHRCGSSVDVQLNDEGFVCFDCLECDHDNHLADMAANDLVDSADNDKFCFRCGELIREFPWGDSAYCVNCLIALGEAG